MTILVHSGVSFGGCDGNSHEYMTNNGTIGKPMPENIGLDTLMSFLVPLLLKKCEYTLQHLGPSAYLSS